MSPGQLLFVRQSTLFAQGFDLQKLETVQDAEPIAGSVPFNTEWFGEPTFSVSQTGTIVFRSGKREREMIWMDRAGRITGVVQAHDENDIASIRLSPDGRTVAFSRAVNGNLDVWLIDVMRGALRRLTSDPADDNAPVWSPDGRYIAYWSRKGKGNLNIFRKAADGTGDDESLVESPENKQVLDWSPDGRYLLGSTTG